MVTRSDQRPGSNGAGSGTTGAPYDASTHAVLGNQLDPNAEAGQQFGYDVSHAGTGMSFGEASFPLLTTAGY